MDELEFPTVPVEPIIEVWRRLYGPHERSDCACTIGGRCASVESLARVVGVSHSTMYRRIRQGFLPELEADHWAVAIGVHPEWVWGAAYDRTARWEDNAEVAIVGVAADITAALGTLDAAYESAMAAEDYELAAAVVEHQSAVLGLS